MYVHLGQFKLVVVTYSLSLSLTNMTAEGYNLYGVFFLQGKYVVKDFTVNIDKTPLPPTLLAGDYHVKYELKGTDKEGRDGICMDLYASIRAK